MCYLKWTWDGSTSALTRGRLRKTSLAKELAPARAAAGVCAQLWMAPLALVSPAHLCFLQPLLSSPSHSQRSSQLVLRTGGKLLIHLLPYLSFTFYSFPRINIQEEQHILVQTFYNQSSWCALIYLFIFKGLTFLDKIKDLIAVPTNWSQSVSGPAERVPWPSQRRLIATLRHGQAPSGMTWAHCGAQRCCLLGSSAPRHFLSQEALLIPLLRLEATEQSELSIYINNLYLQLLSECCQMPAMQSNWKAGRHAASS